MEGWECFFYKKLIHLGLLKQHMSMDPTAEWDAKLAEAYALYLNRMKIQRENTDDLSARYSAGTISTEDMHQQAATIAMAQEKATAEIATLIIKINAEIENIDQEAPE